MTRPRRRVSLPIRALRVGTLGLALGMSPAAPPARAATVRVDLAVPECVAVERRLEELGFDVAGCDPEASTLAVIVDDGEVGRLGAFGTLANVTPSRPYREVAGAAAPEDRYKEYSEVLTVLERVAERYPEIAMAVDLTARYGAPPTWEGRHVWALKISDHVEIDEDEPTVLFDSLHHARELNTIEVTLDAIRWLTTRYGSDSRVTGWVDALEIWVVPVVNPDGLEFVWSDEQFWRKNRRDNGDGTFGVDVNRNYPFLWGVCGNHSDVPGSEVYRGPAEASEPETQTMLALGIDIRPLINVSFHSSGREVLQPYICADLAEPEVVDAVREAFRARMEYGWRVASSSGESFEWFYNQVSSLAYLTEIGTDFQPPFDDTRAEVERVRPGWQMMLDAPFVGPLVQGHVRDATTAEPIAAKIDSDLVPFTEGERRASEPVFGRFGWLLIPGLHELTFSAPGYESLSIPVDSQLGGVAVEVELQPLPTPDR